MSISGSPRLARSPFRKENPPKALRSFAQWAFHSGRFPGAAFGELVGAGASSSSSDSISMTRRRRFGGLVFGVGPRQIDRGFALDGGGVSMAVAVLSVVKLAA